MEYRLFLVVTPGFEDELLREVELKCPVSSVHKVKGGIELTASLEWIITAHTLLKLPTRILMRLTDFKVRDFPKLYQKLCKLKWNTFLSHPEPIWNISSSKSRLNHTGRIEETFKDALASFLHAQPLSEDWKKKKFPPQTFFVRILDDHLTLSLDLSGGPLYKRGLQKIKGEAPIRENLASALLMVLFKGIKTPVTLVDPMCGSGTFLTEALNFHRPLHLRPFAFETAPFFKGKHLKLPPETFPLPVKNVMGFDLDDKLIAKVKEETNLTLTVLDSVKEKLPVHEEFVIICNPPYGERIKIEGKRGSFLKKAWEKFLDLDRPLRFAQVLPSDMDDLFNSFPSYRLLCKTHFRNGGMAVTFWVWEKADFNPDKKLAT